MKRCWLIVFAALCQDCINPMQRDLTTYQRVRLFLSEDQSRLTELPDDVVGSIVSFLSDTERMRIRAVCKQFYRQASLRVHEVNLARKTACNRDSRIRDGAIRAVMMFSRLRVLHLSLQQLPNRLWTNHHLRDVSVACPLLESISLFGCEGVTDVGISYIARPVLGELDIRLCNVNDAAMRFLAAKCPQLRGLHMDQANVSQIQLHRTLAACKELTHLTLTACQVDDSTLTLISCLSPAHLAQLQDLNVNQTLVTVGGLSVLDTQQTALRTVHCQAYGFYPRNYTLLNK